MFLADVRQPHVRYHLPGEKEKYKVHRSYSKFLCVSPPGYLEDIRHEGDHAEHHKEQDGYGGDAGGEVLGRVNKYS